MLHLIKNPITDKSLEGMDSSKGFLNVVNTQDMMYAPDAILNYLLSKLTTWQQIGQVISLLQKAVEIIKNIPSGNYIEFGLASHSSLDPTILQCLKGSARGPDMQDRAFSVKNGEKTSLSEQDVRKYMHQGGFYLYAKGYSPSSNSYTDSTEDLRKCQTLEGEGGAKSICAELISTSASLLYAQASVIKLTMPTLKSAVENGNLDPLSSTLGSLIGRGASVMNLNPVSLNQEVIDSILLQPFYCTITSTVVEGRGPSIVRKALVYHALSMTPEGILDMTDGYYVQGFLDTVEHYLSILTTITCCIESLDQDNQLPTPKSLYELVKFMEVNKEVLLKTTSDVEAALDSRSASMSTYLH